MNAHKFPAASLGCSPFASADMPQRVEAGSGAFLPRQVECESCGGDGTIIEFRPFAGEYMAGEPVEVECLDCDGAGEFDASCSECDEIRNLNEDGMCCDCALSLVSVEHLGPGRIAL